MSTRRRFLIGGAAAGSAGLAASAVSRFGAPASAEQHTQHGGTHGVAHGGGVEGPTFRLGSTVDPRDNGFPRDRRHQRGTRTGLRCRKSFRRRRIGDLRRADRLSGTDRRRPLPAPSLRPDGATRLDTTAICGVIAGMAVMYLTGLLVTA